MKGCIILLYSVYAHRVGEEIWRLTYIVLRYIHKQLNAKKG